MADHDWRGYFGSRVSQLGITAAYDASVTGGRDRITAYANPGDFESVVEAIDTAIDFANDKYEADVLPHVQAERDRKEEKAAETIRQQAALNERAAKLAKPE
jgi:hypothetical protein